MARETYIGGGLVFTEGGLRPASLLIRGKEIVRIGDFPPAEEAELIDATGLAVLPGGIDNHVHFREPGMEAKEGYATGTRGALHGGVTSILEIQNCNPLLTSPAACTAKVEQVGPQAHTHYGIYGNLVGPSLPHLEAMAEWCVGFKLFAGGSTGMSGEGDYAVMEKLLAAAAATRTLVTVHCEDNATIAGCREGVEEGTAREHGLRFRPPEAEILSVERILAIVERTGAEVHFFHISTGRAVELVAAAREAGRPVSASTCPHYLWFNAADADHLGNLLKVNPGIRGPEDQAAIRRHLASGAIEAWSTDHAPHFAAEKGKPYHQAPAGIPAVDLFWPLLLTLVDRGVLTLERAVAAATSEPARIHGLAGKGRLAAGADADLVLVDLERERKVRAAELPSRAEYSPYAGQTLKGWPMLTMVGGEPAFMRDPEGGLHFPDRVRGELLRRTE